MAVVIKTRHAFIESETKIPLNEEAIDYLVFGAIINHDRRIYGSPSFEDLVKYIQGSKQTGHTLYRFIEFTENQIAQSLRRLERSNLIEPHVKDIHKESGEKSYNPLITKK